MILEEIFCDLLEAVSPSLSRFIGGLKVDSGTDPIHEQGNHKLEILQSLDFHFSH